MFLSAYELHYKLFNLKSDSANMFSSKITFI